MPQKTEAHTMLPLPLEVADEVVDGGRQVLLGVQRDAILADLAVEVQSTSTGSPEKVKHLFTA